MRPDRALEMQAELGRRMLDQDWHRYLVSFLSSAAVSSDTPVPTETEGPAYLAYRNKMTQWMSIHGSNEATKARAWFQMVVRAAETFIVAEHMMPLVQRAVADWPWNVPLEPQMLPAETGFLVFDKSYAHKDVQNRTSHTKVLLWHVANGGVRFAELTSLKEPDDVSKDLLKLGQKNQLLLGDLQLSHLQFIPFGKHLDELYNTVNTTDKYAGIPVMPPAVWSLMQQTVVDVKKAHLTPKLKQGLFKRHRIKPRISVITLRHRVLVGDHPDEGGYTHDHRWIVRGHWRNQACGPGRTEHRWIYINPHIKGPENAPLMIRPKVNVLAR